MPAKYRNTCLECGARYTPGSWPQSDLYCRTCFKELEPDWYCEYIRFKIDTTRRLPYL